MVRRRACAPESATGRWLGVDRWRLAATRWTDRRLPIRLVFRRSNRRRRLGPRGRRPIARPEIANDGGQALAVDELHGVIMDPFVAAHAEDRDDMRVVKLGGRLGLNLEPLALFGIDGGRERKDLEGHAPAERELLGLVDDTHPAASDLTQDVVIAKLRVRGQAWRIRADIGSTGDPESSAAAAWMNSSPEKQPFSAAEISA